MKPEPLKGKAKDDWSMTSNAKEFDDWEEVWLRQDIASAVEWLKKELTDLTGQSEFSKIVVRKKIDEAFEDVVKK